METPLFQLGVFCSLSLSLSLSVMAYEFARPEFSCRVESAVVKSCKPKGGRCLFSVILEKQTPQHTEAIPRDSMAIKHQCLSSSNLKYTVTGTKYSCPDA